jgi:hypothetical protein
MLLPMVNVPPPSLGGNYSCRFDVFCAITPFAPVSSRWCATLVCRCRSIGKYYNVSVVGHAFYMAVPKLDTTVSLMSCKLVYWVSIRAARVADVTRDRSRAAMPCAYPRRKTDRSLVNQNA